MTKPNMTTMGRCTCGDIHYRLDAPPMMIHCCHCTWCQRETGTAFALNAMLEADCVTLIKGEPEIVVTPSNSGRGQKIARCPRCRIALWSNYAGAGDGVRFVRVGTLDEPGRFPPDVHIFTSTKMPWVVLPDHCRSFVEFYEFQTTWTPQGMQRLKRAKSRNTSG